ncbi:MAG: hypothetical protein ACRD9R_08195 [Pyrinomonadaceae bacterium]
MDIIENHDYHRLLLMYQGKLTPAALLAEAFDDRATTLGSATVGYGVGIWYLYNERREAAFQVFRRITAGSQRTSFGYMAAEAELKRKR